MSDGRGGADGKPVNPWLVASAVMLTTVMVILDMTIVNVAMPHMMGALGATSDEITWVLTSYIVADGIFIPASGFLAQRLGRRRLLLISVVGFVAASALCGLSESLAQMVLFRVLQGAFGASVIPLSQSIMVDEFPPEQRGRAMAIWGLGVMMGPILGPTIGGLIVQNLDWRWVFYINVPVGILNVFMVLAWVRQTARHRLPVDWIGAGLMALGIGCGQVVLDRGNQEDWFHSYLIQLAAFTSVVCLIWFAVRAWRRPDGIVRLKLLRDRNLATASFMMVAFGFGMFGTIALQPLLLQNVLGYQADTTGLVMAPRGIASGFSMVLVGQLIQRVDPRYLVAFGLVISAFGAYFMSHYNLFIDPWWAIWPGLLQGVGIGMIFVPLSTIAYATLARSATDQGSAIFNIARTIGSSVGISIASTVTYRLGQVTWGQLGGHIDRYNPAVHDYLANRGLSLTDPLAPHILGQELLRQSQMLAYVDAFWLIAISFIALAPLALLLRRGAKDAAAPPGGH